MVYLLLKFRSKSDRRSQILNKFRLRRSVQYSFLRIKWFSSLLHCRKRAPNPTAKDQKSSKNFACGRQFSILSSELNGFHSCYIAGKVLKIRSKNTNCQKKIACGGQFRILSSELNGFHHCYIAGKMLQIRRRSKSDRRSKKFACGGQFSILSSALNGFHHCWKSAPDPTENHKSLLSPASRGPHK